MQLAKAKVAGHHVVNNSGWFPVNKKLTILAGTDGAGKSTILKGLLALNPIPSQKQRNTFIDYPKYLQKKEYRKKIDPAKKTAAFGIFTCNKTLLNLLVNIDPVLYEADMIQVGRRLNLSRWITFVEIASSTRWSEIEQDTFSLQDFVVTQTNAQKLVDQFEQFSHTKSTDRITGELAEKIGAWLNTIEKFIDATHRTLFDRVRFGVYRFNRFTNAKQAVSDHIPYFLYFPNSHLLQAEIDLSKPNKIDTSLKGFFELEPKSSPSIQKIKTWESCVNTLLKKYWPDISAQSSFEINGNILTLSMQGLDNTTIPIDKGDPVCLWQMSLIVALIANTDNSPNNIILLLDEPDSNIGKKNQEKIKDAINQIAHFFQVIMTTKSNVFIQEDDILKGVALLMKEDDESGTTVEPAESFEQITDLLEKS